MFTVMKLAEYLAAKKTTASAFAEKIKANQPTIFRYLNNDRFPNREMIARIAAATGNKVTVVDWYQQAEEAKAAKTGEAA